MSARRKWKKKLLALVAVVGVVLLLLLARCADGFGFGSGDGEADDRSINPIATTTSSEPPSPPCEIRVDATAVRVGDATCPIDEIAVRCNSTRARLTVTGDARHGDAEAVRTRLRDAGIEILDREIAAPPK